MSSDGSPCHEGVYSGKECLAGSLQVLPIDRSDRHLPTCGVLPGQCMLLLCLSPVHWLMAITCCLVSASFSKGCNVSGLSSAEAQASLTAALDDFFGKKKSKLHR